MNLATLERLAAGLALFFLLAVCALVLDHSRRSGHMVKGLMENRLEATAVLDDTDRALSLARQIYGGLLEDRAVGVDDALFVLNALLARLNRADGPAAETVTAMAMELARFRSGLLLIEDMRARDEFTESMTPTVEEVKGRLAAASSAQATLASRNLLPGDTLYFLHNALDSLKSLSTSYLEAKPDRLPVFIELMAKIARDLDKLAALPGMEPEAGALATLAREVDTLRVNVPRLRANILYDPNFMANTNRGEKEEVKRLWDASMVSLQSIKERQSRALRKESEAFQDGVASEAVLLLVVTAAALALTVAGLWAVRRALGSRVAQLKAGAGRISGGDLDHRIQPVQQDVLGELAQAFNTMAESLSRERQATAEAMAELEQSRDLLDKRFTERNWELGAAMESLRVKDSVLAHSLQGVIVCDETLRIVDANPAMTRLTGYPPSSLRGMTPDCFCAGASAARFRKALQKVLDGGDRFEGEVTIAARDGRTVPLRVLFARVAGAQEGTARHIGICLDISEQKDTEMRLAMQSRSDGLTGLPNREATLVDLEQRIDKFGTDGQGFAVILLDLDGFKTINDSLGHAAGDALLKIASQRLEARMRQDVLVARLGEDEFALVSGPLDSPAQALSLAKRARDCFCEPFEFSGETCRLSASTGLALYPGDGLDAQTLLKNAGLALHRAKAHGKGGLEVFTQELDIEVRSRMTLERDLREAVEGGRFQVHYQPIVDAAACRVVGAEALMRWSRDGKPVSPGVFIPLCEEMRLMRRVTGLLLERATRDMASWDSRGLSLPVCVNISAQHFSEPDFTERVEAALSRHGIAPERFGLEITETAVMKNPDAAAEMLLRLRRTGHPLSVDDFGTGYCSLRYLQKFPFTALKIDRQFIADVTQRESRAIVTATIAMAKSLGLAVIAEGVETDGQRDLLRQKGCDYFQGFLFSPALPSEAFVQYCLGQDMVQAGEAPTRSLDALP